MNLATSNSERRTSNVNHEYRKEIYMPAPLMLSSYLETGVKLVIIVNIYLNVEFQAWISKVNLTVCAPDAVSRQRNGR